MLVLTQGRVKVSHVQADGVALTNLCKVSEQWPEDFGYFGHLRSWQPGDLRRALVGVAAIVTRR